MNEDTPSFPPTEVTDLNPPSLQETPEKQQDQEPETATLAQTVSRFFRLILLALVLVLVALISALTAMRIAIHGREVEVPKLTGMTQPEAEAVLFDRGLRLEVENRFYGADVPEGRVLSQSPAAGTVVRRGWRVRVAESLGTPRATVPNVIGQSGRAAEINVRRRGLEVGKLATVHLPDQPSDQVVAMSPPPETIGNSPKVNLLLTGSAESDAMLMPNLVGKKAPDAEKVVEQIGLRLAKGRAAVLNSGARPSTVRRQTPAAGSKVGYGTIVTLEVTH
jgi:eukaryotic-like serine/threonine-protein kinase